MKKTFLTAEWRKLAIANYLIDPSVLIPYLPAEVELDLWNGRCYMSLVGFLFLNTAVKGCKIPFHNDFEEVNLRFYVKHKKHDVWTRGVVFIREFVPLPMVALIANTIYRERYRAVPMKQEQEITVETLRYKYSWKRSRWFSFEVNATNLPQEIEVGSEAEFITEHYWGYSKKRKHTSAYQVAHERWKQYPVNEFTIDVDFAECYGRDFEVLNHGNPVSVLFAEGSAVTIYGDQQIRK